MGNHLDSRVSVSPEEFKLHYDYYIASHNLNKYIIEVGKSGSRYKYYFNKFVEAFEALDRYYTTI